MQRRMELMAKHELFCKKQQAVKCTYFYCLINLYCILQLFLNGHDRTRKLIGSSKFSSNIFSSREVVTANCITFYTTRRQNYAIVKQNYRSSIYRFLVFFIFSTNPEKIEVGSFNN
mmetsp:Transcript_10674/g.12234  ORF Transcript_10674/g.12234 Transcript_10674/m.12234 type:complete len:116 (+) Transcript_10674:20-367(+)